MCKSHIEDIEWWMAWTDKGQGGVDHSQRAPVGPRTHTRHSPTYLMPTSTSGYFTHFQPVIIVYRLSLWVPLGLGDLLPGCPGAPWFWQTQEVHAAKCCKPAGPGNCNGSGRAFAALRALSR